MHCQFMKCDKIRGKQSLDWHFSFYLTSHQNKQSYYVKIYLSLAKDFQGKAAQHAQLT